MPGFFIDPDLCNHDGLCAAVCPMALFETREGAPPRPVDDAEERCITCGHCVAVCPTAALSLSTMSPADCVPFERELDIDAPRALQFLRRRRSIRTFKSKPVPDDLLRQALDITRWAPTATNRQPVHWSVSSTSDKTREIAGHVVDFLRHLLQDGHPATKAYRIGEIVAGWEAGADFICRGAPQLAMASAPAQIPFMEADCVTSITYLDLGAQALGFGACWAGFVTFAAKSHAPLIEALNLPEGHEVYGGLMLGYPRFRYPRIPDRRPLTAAWL